MVESPRRRWRTAEPKRLNDSPAGSTGSRLSRQEIGFMSRQKRVSRSRSHREMVYMHPAQFVLSFLAIFSGETAPLASVLRAALNWAATNFLHTDYPHRHFAQPAFAVALSGLG